MRGIVLPALASVLVGACASAETANPEWHLIEELRIGDETGEMTMFTDLRSIVAGPDGRIFVLDARPQEIRVFDREGTFMTLAARKGQGPGEIAGANGMLLAGDTIWVNDPPNGRWSAWSAVDGTYLRQVSIPINSYGYLWDAGLDAEGRILDPISVSTGKVNEAGNPVSERRLRRVRTDGQVVDTLPIPTCVQSNPPAKTTFTGATSGPRGGRMVTGIPFLANPVAAMDREGGFWCSPNDEYLLVRYAIDGGDTLARVTMPHTRLRVSDAEREKAIGDARKSLERYEVIDADYSLIPAEHPVFDRLQVDDQGRLWARRVAAADSAAGFDVYDPAGRRVASVAGSVRFERYPPIMVQGEHVYGVLRDADDIPYVVRARIVRGAPGAAR